MSLHACRPGRFWLRWGEDFHWVIICSPTVLIWGEAAGCRWEKTSRGYFSWSSWWADAVSLTFQSDSGWQSAALHSFLSPLSGFKMWELRWPCSKHWNTGTSPNTTVKVKPTFWNISTRADQTTDTDRPNSFMVEYKEFVRECGYYFVYIFLDGWKILNLYLWLVWKHSQA